MVMVNGEVWGSGVWPRGVFRPDVDAWRVGRVGVVVAAGVDDRALFFGSRRWVGDASGDEK